METCQRMRDGEVVRVAEKAGYHISFMGSMKAGFVPMPLTVAIVMGCWLIAY